MAALPALIDAVIGTSTLATPRAVAQEFAMQSISISISTDVLLGKCILPVGQLVAGVISNASFTIDANINGDGAADGKDIALLVQAMLTL